MLLVFQSSQTILAAHLGHVIVDRRPQGCQGWKQIKVTLHHRKFHKLGRPVAGLAGLLVLSALTTVRADNLWTNVASGVWHDAANWSSGIPSVGNSHIQITNAASKIITINAATATGFPDSLTINQLTLRAPAPDSNVLALVNASVPLLILDSCTVNDGGAIAISNSTFQVAGQSAGYFNILAGTVTLDAGAIVANTATTRVGRVGAGSLSVRSGSVTTSQLIVGEFAGSQGTLSIAGGVVTATLEIPVGDKAGATGHLLMTGGLLFVTNDLNYKIRVGDAGTGVMTVSNATAVAGDMSVGRHGGSQGTLTIQQGGVVRLLTDISIGRFSDNGGAATGTVWVTGGELIATNGNINVGREGVGRLILDSGTISAVNIVVATNLIARGTLTLGGGTINVVSNVFIGANAQLTGCGTINGSVNNAGIIVADCPTPLVFTGPVVNNGTIDAIHGSVNFQSSFINNGVFLDAAGDPDGDGFSNLEEDTAGTDPLQSTAFPHVFTINVVSNDVVVQIQSVAGRTYQLQRRNSPTSAGWTNLPPAVVGNGATATFTDSGAAALTQHIYRVLITLP